MKIGDNPTNLNNASLLELESTNKGFVLPRVSLNNVDSSTPLPASLITGTVVFNTNASTTGGNGVGLYFWNGSAWAAVSQIASSTAWSLTGNSGTNSTTNFLGTTDNIGFRVRTNNIQRLVIDSLGDVAIGSEAFNPVNRERLLVDYGITTSHTVANFKGNINDYFQINIQNTNSGSKASSDYVATADDGTDSTYYIDMGINSSSYNPSPENWGNFHDAYLYSNSRNLLIGTQTPNSDVIFLLGGGRIKDNTVMRINGPNGNIIIGNGDNTDLPTGNTIRGPNGNGTNIKGGNLTLRGGSGTGTAAGGNLNLYGGSSESGASGAINITANPLNISGVQATTSFITDSILTIFNGVVKKAPNSSLPGASWSLTGNSGTNVTGNFIGTTDSSALAFRVNNVKAGTIGLLTSGSIALGANATTSGSNTTAIGANAVASAINTTALGASAGAKKSGAVALGNSTLSLDLNTIAIGQSAAASGTQAIALGAGASATKSNSIVIGQSSTAAGINSIVLGDSSTVSGDSSTAIGNNINVTQRNVLILGNSFKKIGIGTTAPTYKLQVMDIRDPLFLGGVQATSAFTTDSILTIFNGVVKKAPYSSLTGSFSATAPLTYNSTTGVIAINKATTTTDGYLSSTDWNVFNNKVGSITLGTPDLIYNNPVSFSVTNGIATGALSFKTQTANKVFAGPASGANATPTFRALVAADIPSLAANYIQNQTTLQASSNFNISGSGTIGSALSVTGTSTLTGAVTSKAGIINTGSITSSGGILSVTQTNPLYLSGVQPTSSFTTDSILAIFNGVVKKTPYSSLPGGGGGGGWSLTGNSGTNASNFIGTLDNVGFRVRTNNIQRLLIDSLGNVNIQAQSVKAKLDTGGSFLILNHGKPGVDELVKLQIRETGEVNWYLDGEDLFMRDGFFDAFGNGTLYKYDFMHIDGATGRIGFNILNGYSDGSAGGETNLPLTSSITLLGSIATKVRLLDGSANYVIQQDDHIMIIDKADNTNTDMILSPVATSRGREYIFKRNNSGDGKIIVKPDPGEKLNGIVDGSVTLGKDNSTLEVVCGPDSWWVISEISTTTLRSFSATAPLTYNNTTGVFAINKATATTDGYLSLTDWNTFKNKIQDITLNTPGVAFQPVVFTVNAGVATGTLSFNTTKANTVLAGPTSGADAIPTFRALTAADLPSGSGSYIQNQTTPQALSNFNISGNGTIGTNLTVTGTSDMKGILRLSGSASGYVGFQSPAAAGATIYTLPGTDGTNGQVLTTSGSGSLSWTSVAGGGGGNSWLITGNNNVNSSNFLGTTDPNVPLIFKVGGVQAGYLGITSSGITTFGIGATAGGQQSTALGAGATASQQTSLAVGYNANASSQNAIAIGNNSNSSITGGIAMGSGATASSQNGIAIGAGAQATTSLNTLAIGTNAKATAQNATAFGYNALASTIGGNAFGNLSNASGTNSLAVGNSTTASGSNSISIGDQSIAAGTSPIILGYNSSTAAGTSNSIVLGTGSTITNNASSTILIGDGLTTSQSNVLILGNSSKTVGISTTTPNANAKLDVNGPFKLGALGTVIGNIVKTTATNLTPILVDKNGAATLTLSGIGLAIGATVIVNPRVGNPTIPLPVAIAYAFVSAANTVKINFITNDNSSQTIPANTTFDITIIQ